MLCPRCFSPLTLAPIPYWRRSQFYWCEPCESSKVDPTYLCRCFCPFNDCTICWICHFWKDDGFYSPIIVENRQRHMICSACEAIIFPNHVGTVELLPESHPMYKNFSYRVYCYECNENPQDAFRRSKDLNDVFHMTKQIIDIPQTSPKSPPLQSASLPDSETEEEIDVEWRLEMEREKEREEEGEEGKEQLETEGETEIEWGLEMEREEGGEEGGEEEREEEQEKEKGQLEIESEKETTPKALEEEQIFLELEESNLEIKESPGSPLPEKEPQKEELDVIEIVDLAHEKEEQEQEKQELEIESEEEITLEALEGERKLLELEDEYDYNDGMVVSDSAPIEYESGVDIEEEEEEEIVMEEENVKRTPKNKKKKKKKNSKNKKKIKKTKENT